MASSGRRKIQLAFYRKDDQATGWESCSQCLAVWWTRTEGHEYSHVEMVFPEDRVSVRTSDGRTIQSPNSCSVCEGETVHYDAKGFGRPGYGFIDITVSAAQETRMRNFCKRMSQRSVPFNYTGQWLNFLPANPFKVNKCGQAVFCSELMVLALQEGGVFDSSVQAHTTSPNDLWVLACRHPHACISYNVNKDHEYAESMARHGSIYAPARSHASSPAIGGTNTHWV